LSEGVSGGGGAAGPDGVVAIVPARLGATRLPGKPLLAATGTPLVVHVCEQVAKAQRIARVIVATDSEEIARAVVAAGFEARMTSKDHPSGTDRVAEVAAGLAERFLINVQGDEPEIAPADLDALAACLESGEATLATLAFPLTESAAFESRHAVKVVLDGSGHALYFSRAPIPSPLGGVPPIARKHVGVYAFERETLLRFASLPPCPLETIERLEQLRALWHGMRIRVLEATRDSLGIDTQEDYDRFVARHAARGDCTAARRAT
jgi:3-deoxy-manno-octulosonate cytidylyltransferase (CMP-KDO synthetase)